MESKDYDHLFKIIVCGDRGVGKSSLIDRAVRNEFDLEKKQTDGFEFSTKRVEYENKQIKLEIKDTGGREGYEKLRKNGNYRGAVGVIVVFDPTKRQTFENLTEWDTQITNTSSPNITKILVVNKWDIPEKHRECSQEEIINFAKQKNYKNVVFTSALTALNVEQVFTLTAGYIYDDSYKRDKIEDISEKQNDHEILPKGPKEELEERLKDYIRTIESYAGNSKFAKTINKYQSEKEQKGGDKQNKQKITVNFAQNLRCSIWEAPQAANREATLRTARKTLKKLENLDSDDIAAIKDLFSKTNIDKERNTIIIKHNLPTRGRKINSTTFNRIADYARSLKEENNNHLDFKK